MDALTISAASGMRARIESFEMLANNLANQGSAGFKMDREFYSLYISPEARYDADPFTLPVIERHWTDFAQGTLTDTGNPFHFAINGRGFFVVAGPGGNLYTRNGSFRAGQGGAIETQEGYALLDTAGKPVQINPSEPFELTASGEIRQAGLVRARIGVVTFAQPDGLSKHSGTFFQWNAPGPAGTPSAQDVLHQGRLESANGSAPESAVRLVGILRQFEMLQKAMQIGAEMGRRADEVARVSS